MRPSDLDDVAPFVRLGLDRGGESLGMRQKALLSSTTAMCIAVGNVSSDDYPC
jgi:hypothetical protein